MRDLGALKVPKKVHQNRLTHLCVAVVNRLYNSMSHQKSSFFLEFCTKLLIRAMLASKDFTAAKGRSPTSGRAQPGDH